MPVVDSQYGSITELFPFAPPSHTYWVPLDVTVTPAAWSGIAMVFGDGDL